MNIPKTEMPKYECIGISFHSYFQPFNAVMVPDTVNLASTKNPTVLFQFQQATYVATFSTIFFYISESGKGQEDQ